MQVRASLIDTDEKQHRARNAGDVMEMYRSVLEMILMVHSGLVMPRQNCSLKILRSDLEIPRSDLEILLSDLEILHSDLEITCALIEKEGSLDNLLALEAKETSKFTSNKD